MDKRNADWRTKMFLLQCHETGLAARTEFFRNGDWCIHRDGLAEIMEKISKPKIEKRKTRRRICLLCAEEEFDVLSHEVEHWADYSIYRERESLLIITSVDYDMHCYEMKIPFGARKEKAIIAKIEKDAPAGIEERAKYYREQADELEELRRGNRRCGGCFLLCPQHSHASGINGAFKRIVETSYHWRRELIGTGSEHFLTSFPAGIDFLKAHYAAREIMAGVRWSEKLEIMIRNHAHLFGFDTEA